MAPLRSVFALLLFAITAGVVFGQTAISVSDSNGWNAWITADGITPAADPRSDRQTGQGADDFVGDSTYYVMQQKAGTISGVDSIAFRARMDVFDSKGFGGNLILGIDLDGNGTMDLMLKMTDSKGTQTVTFASPGAGTNSSPSTTTWGSWLGASTLTASNYSYLQANDGMAFGGTDDAWVSFGLAFSTLENAVRTYAGAAFASFTMDYNTRLSFIAFTSVQGNSMNQDLLGTSGNLSSTMSFADLGAGTAPANAFGVVPEPATYVQFGVLVLAAGLVHHLRRKKRAAKNGA